MFARFKNLFAKNKTETDADANADAGASASTNTVVDTNTSSAGNVTGDEPKLEGLNFLKSIVENEQMLVKPQSDDANKQQTITNSSFTQEVQELLENNLTSSDKIPKKNEDNHTELSQYPNSQKVQELLQNNLNSKDKIESLPQDNHKELSNNSNFNSQTPLSNINSEIVQPPSICDQEDPTDTESVHSLVHKMKTEIVTLDYETKVASPLLANEKGKPISSPDESLQLSTDNLMPNNSKTSNVISWIEENNVIFTPPTPYPLASTESAINLHNSSSIVVEDLPTEITAPSPSMESSISGSSNSNSISTTADSTSTRLAADPTKIVVNPTGSNGMACNAITGKLTDIAEVAESLDTVIRDIQENSQCAEMESNPSPRDKKLGTLRSTSSEDWHSRSTEDESFVTASEGRTSSYMSCNKSSFDYSEGDDSTLAFDMPDVNSPFNMSFDESEQSFISAQQDTNKTPTKLSENDEVTLEDLEAPSSLADIEDLHSESVTPTPAETEELYVDSIPVESETELEVAAIANASSLQVLTECPKMPMSLTPEVSSCSNARQMLDEASPSSSSAINVQESPTNTNDNSQAKTNLAWRRSKYYENITKQTIKGFL